MTEFFRYQLRTTNPDAARAFYAAILGGPCEADIVPLHERALARGARPHWLGYLRVGGVEPAAASFIERGAMQLGPTWVNAEGMQAAVFRDPGGAVIALAEEPSSPAQARTRQPPRVSREDVVWHELNTSDVERAKADYGALFGWEFKAPLDLGNLGVLHPFSFRPGAAPAGSMADVRGRPGVHTHWLFHVRVAALDEALAAVRALGGLVIGPIVLPGGDRIAVCDDPQGAAFALRESPVKSAR